LCALWQRRLWLLGFLFGFAWTSYAAQIALDARLPEELDRRDVRLSGWVDEFPQSASSRLRLTVSITDAELPMLTGRRIRLSWYDPRIDLQPGQQISVTARLRTPHGFVNPAGFDYERWLLRERIVATGYVRTLHELRSRQNGFAPWLLALRARIRAHIAMHVPSIPAQSLVTALAIGERSGFSDRHWQIFRRTGTSHLVAISGLHIGIVALAVLWPAQRLFRMSGGWFVERCGTAAAVTALMAAVLYAGLAGFSISTLRAVTMLAVALVIAGMLREVSRFYGIALAAVVLTAVDPLATLGSSFWLSFGAVGTLLLATVPRSVAPAASGLKQWSRGAVRVQLAVAVVAVPAGAAFFGEFSLIALVINLIAIPFFGLVLVPLVLLCVLIELFLGAPQWTWNAIAWLAENAMAALATAATFPFASIVVPSPGFIVTMLSMCGVVLMLDWNPQRSRLAGTIALAPLIWPRHDLLPREVFRLSVLDVGHGLAAIIETRGYLLIYDAGARFDSEFDVGRDVVLPELRARHIPSAMIISHGDNDHSGGAAAIIAAYPDLFVLAGPDVELSNSGRCTAGQRWTRDGVDFELLHPSARFSARGNDSSCVLRVSGPGGSALLTGDIERAGEAAILASSNIDVDVVIAPHHGSETSSTAALVAATSPSAAIFSAAYGNRWNFPRPTVVARWCAIGADVYVTGEQGAIEVTVGNASVRVVAQRRKARRYWRTTSEPRCGESPDVTL
jgi:competence protein ComEC